MKIGLASASDNYVILSKVFLAKWASRSTDLSARSQLENVY